MIVSFGVAEDAAAQRKVDFRFGSKADMKACAMSTLLKVDINWLQ
jgi:hypothetical protein